MGGSAEQEPSIWSRENKSVWFAMLLFSMGMLGKLEASKVGQNVECGLQGLKNISGISEW